MSGLRKLERDHISADLATVEAMIGKLTDEDIVMRISLQERGEELRRELEALRQTTDSTASAALFFGGRPVVGGRGIESEFGAKALETFQDLVAKEFSHDVGGLGQRGVVPNKGLTRLHITNIVRGSFGFLLEELNTEESLFDSSLKMAVDNVSRLLLAFGEEDEERFEASVENVDKRVLATARSFFSLLKRDGATFRLVAGESDRSFDRARIERSAARAEITDVEDSEERLIGVLAGVLPDAHRFEFRAEPSQDIIQGAVDRSITAPDLAAIGRTWLDQRGIAVVTARRVLKAGEIVRSSYTLKAMQPA